MVEAHITLDDHLQKHEMWHHEKAGTALLVNKNLLSLNIYQCWYLKQKPEISWLLEFEKCCRMSPNAKVCLTLSFLLKLDCIING